jgi:hypothetical protein
MSGWGKQQQGLAGGVVGRLTDTRIIMGDDVWNAEFGRPDLDFGVLEDRSLALAVRLDFHCGC